MTKKTYINIKKATLLLNNIISISEDWEHYIIQLEGCDSVLLSKFEYSNKDIEKIQKQLLLINKDL